MLDILLRKREINNAMTNSNNENVKVGGALLSELNHAADDALMLTQDNDPVPFDITWHSIFAKWERQLSNSDESMVLIFSETPQIIGNAQLADIVYQFGVIDKIQPGVYIVGKSPNGNAWKLKKSSSDHQINCKVIVESGLDRSLCIAIGISKGFIIFLPDGISGNSIKLPLDVGGTPLSEETLDDHLGGFAEECLNGQEYRSKIWKEASKWIPVKLAEQEIQSLLVCGLRTAFLGYSICSETKLPNGRADLLIISKDPSEARRAVLELKVARSLNSEGQEIANTVVFNHLRDGVTQAMEYGQKMGATHKSLCTYDMRKTKGGDIIENVRTECENNGVKLRVYDVYNSSKNTRNAGAIS